MILFQWLALIAIAGFILVVIAARRRERLGRLTALGWILFWLAAALAIAFPDTTSSMARAVSIARGSDLVFYVYILASSAALFLLVLRIRRMDRVITRLIRELALEGRVRGGGDGDAPERS